MASAVSSIAVNGRSHRRTMTVAPSAASATVAAPMTAATMVIRCTVARTSVKERPAIT